MQNKWTAAKKLAREANLDKTQLRVLLKDKLKNLSNTKDKMDLIDIYGRAFHFYCMRG